MRLKGVSEMAERYPGKRSEYGGGDGKPQRLPDGASIDLPGIPSAVGERARIMRQVGMRDFDPGQEDAVGLAASGLNPSAMSAAQRAAYEHDLEISKKRAAERAELSEKTNAYSEEVDQWVGESGAGNSVDPIND